jgi:hypothetical protein
MAPAPAADPATRQAKSEGVSINSLVTAIIAEAIRIKAAAVE